MRKLAVTGARDGVRPGWIYICLEEVPTYTGNDLECQCIHTNMRRGPEYFFQKWAKAKKLEINWWHLEYQVEFPSMKHQMIESMGYSDILVVFSVNRLSNELIRLALKSGVKVHQRYEMDSGFCSRNSPIQDLRT